MGTTSLAGVGTGRGASARKGHTMHESTTRSAAAVLCAAVLARSLSLGTAGMAHASSSIGGGQYTCTSQTYRWVEIRSEATGRVNHKEGVTVLNSWQNGSTYKWRNSVVGKSTVPSWQAYLTGIGGNIRQASVGCAAQVRCQSGRARTN